jgi:hypothetical protein
MAYGTETHGNRHWYEVTVNHTPTNTNIMFEVSMSKADGTTPPEANRDAMFQAILDKLVSLNNITVISSTKNGYYIAPVTSP